MQPSLRALLLSVAALAAGSVGCAEDTAPYSANAEPDAPTTSVSQQWSVDELEAAIRSEAMHAYVNKTLTHAIEAPQTAPYYADWAHCNEVARHSERSTPSERSCTVYEQPFTKSIDVVDELYIVADVQGAHGSNPHARLDVFYHRRGDASNNERYAGIVQCSGDGFTCATASSIRLYPLSPNAAAALPMPMRGALFWPEAS